jgi:hypothetical protein
MGTDEDRQATMADVGSDDAASELPTVDRLLQPVLAALDDGQTRELPAVVDVAADALGLSEASRALRTKSGSTVLENRVGWARTSLVRAGLVAQPRPSAVVITPAGRDALASAERPIDGAYLRQECPGYANWIADMGGELPEDELTGAAAATVWMVRAGRGGSYAPVFVERSTVVVGWGNTGDVDELQRDAILELIKTRYPEMRGNHRAQGANTLYRIANTMRPGDLVLTPEPVTRTILFGRVDGPYRFLEDPIGGDIQHSRGIAWFARVSRDELSYGARSSLGSLMTLTRPSYEAELLRIADTHAADPSPKPLEQRAAHRPVPQAVIQKVTISSDVEVAPRPALGDFQTVRRKLMQLLEELESGQLALPDFQRSFVWAPDATRELLVSMIRSFPAGALLFLQGGSSTFKARAVEQAPALQIQPSYLVLDGQQRLTSLYQAVRGVGQSRFFLDLGALISGAEINDAVRVFSAERAESLETLDAQAQALMMPIQAVLNGGAGRWRDEVVDLRGDEDPPRVRGLLRAMEQTYIEPLVQYAFPVTLLPQETELEAVCTIFETLNRTGKPLTPFELISARAFAGGHSLYDLWSSALERYPILGDFGVEPYYVLQVIALRLGLSCKRSAVLGLAADDIASEWDEAISDMAAVVSLLRDECGVLVRKWLPYRPMLIPLAGAWREIACTQGPEHAAMRTKLRRWFWCACFTGEYESSSASLAERDTPLLRAWLAGGDEPSVVAAFDWSPERWRTVTVRQQGLYRATIALTLTQHPRDFHTGAPLTREVIEANKVDDHHVFPRGYLADVGRSSDVDSVLNHCLIDRATNIRIGKKAPSVYLQEIRAALGGDLDEVLESQMLPVDGQTALATDDIDGFLDWRLERLSDALGLRADALDTITREVDPQLAKLDGRVEAVELRMRELIITRLDNDAKLVPQHVAQKVNERIAATDRKYPGRPGGNGDVLSDRLEFFDLRELQDVICAKPAWPAFEQTFRTKEALSTRFTQLAELRNAIRHSRVANPVTVKDAEAALLWFEQIFDAIDDDSELAAEPERR